MSATLQSRCVSEGWISFEGRRIVIVPKNYKTDAVESIARVLTATCLRQLESKSVTHRIGNCAGHFNSSVFFLKALAYNSNLHDLKLPI